VGVDTLDLPAVAPAIEADQDMRDANVAQPVEQRLLAPGVKRHLSSVTLGLFGQDAGQFGRDFRGRRSAAGKADGRFGISGKSG